MARERELQQQVKEARDAEIERVMQQLLKDNQQSIDECEREADKRIKYVVCIMMSHLYTELKVTCLIYVISPYSFHILCHNRFIVIRSTKYTHKK